MDGNNSFQTQHCFQVPYGFLLNAPLPCAVRTLKNYFHYVIIISYYFFFKFNYVTIISRAQDDPSLPLRLEVEEKCAPSLSQMKVNIAMSSLPLWLTAFPCIRKIQRKIDM